MKKFAVLLVMAFLTLMVSSSTYAAPDLVNTFSVSPSPVAIGGTATFQGTYAVTTPGTTQVAICFYFTTADEPSWDTNFTALGSAAGVPFSKYAAADPCPVVPSYQSIAFFSTNTTNAGLGDTFTQNVTVPNIPVGVKNAVARYYEGSACDDANAPGTANCNAASNYIMANFTVDPAVPAPTPDTGLSGRIIDSKTLGAWAYGGEIKVQQTTGTNVGLKGTSYIANDGTWSVAFNSTDELALCGGSCSAGNENATYVVTVNFKCNLETTVGTRLTTADGTQFAADGHCPIAGMTAIPVQFQVTVIDGATGAIFDVGDWETGRGPTAVSLQNVTAGNNTTTAAGIAFVVVMLAGVTFITMRRREVA